MSKLDSLITSNRARTIEAAKSIANKLEIDDDSPQSIKYLWIGSQAEYDNLEETSDDTLYIIN